MKSVAHFFILYLTAAYLRLSRDDNNGSAESMSIQSQKEMLTSYAHEKGYEVSQIYIDDGFSGTNFERPNFKRMINDIKAGKINMVITKDLSRLGRNYVMTGQYTDFFFPEYGVRYVAINDNYDSGQGENDIAPFKHILNEMYAADISKKIRSSRKVAAKQGKFMGSMPSYGYKRSDEDSHKLIIDEVSAKVVRRIFELFKNNSNARRIADTLNAEKVLTPQNYYYQSIEQENPYKKNAKTWCSATVISILKKEVYIGQMVQSKCAVRSFKSKKRESLPPEMWVVVEGTHSAIIDMPTWNAVQLLLAKNKNSKPKKTLTSDISLFSNLIRCKCCDSKVTFNSNQRKTKVDFFYRCSRYIQHVGEACSPHRISLKALSGVALEDIRNNARLAKEDEDAFIRRLHQASLSEKNSELEQFRKREYQIQKRLGEINALIQKTFEKNCAGILPDSMMKNLLDGYEKEKFRLEDDLSALSVEMMKAESQTADISREIEKLKKYADITEFNCSIVTSLIQSIHISEPRTVNGEKQYEIDIRYKFQNTAGTKKETSSANEVSFELREAVSF